MPAFNTPNPYGSYFNFNSAYGGDPTPSLWRNPNYPNMGAPVSQGVASAMGSPSGGINPTETEFLNTRRRDIAFQSFIDRAIKEDPRTRTMGNMLLDSIYGNDTRAKTLAMARVGGADAYQGIIGTVMNTPGLSGYFGGSARSLAVGSLAIGTSGLTMNGYGVFGDKSMNLRFADEMMRQVNSRFYAPNGNPILSMTNGLNRDQMGGVMVQAASQGAFTGLDMGMFQKLDAAGRTSKFIANGSTVQKITEFMKDTTKALGSLIDVYGNISSGELLQKAQQITGLDLSRLGNAKLMSERLQRLRDISGSTGIDVQSAFDFSARAVDYGTAIGLRPEMAGSIGGYATRQGWMNYRARQLNTSGFYTNTVSPMEMIQSSVRDQTAMSQDPLGARFYALQMAITNSGMDATSAANLRNRASGFSANAAGVSAFDQMFQSNFGMSAPGLIRAMGGTAGLQQQLSPRDQELAAEAGNRNLMARQGRLIGYNLSRGGIMPMGSTRAQIAAMHGLVTTFDDQTISKLLDSGSSAGDIAGIVGKILGPNASGALSDINTIRGMGAGGVLAYHNTRSAIQANELTKGFRSQESWIKNAYMNMTQISTEARGQLLGGGFMAGMMDKYSGNDPMGQLMWLQKNRPDVVAGLGRGQSISMDFASFMNADGSLNMGAWQNAAKQWRSGLERTPEGAAISRRFKLNGIGGPNNASILTDFYNTVRDPGKLQDLMSGFNMYGLDSGKGVAFARSSDLAQKGLYGDTASDMLAVANDLSRAGGSETEVANFRMYAAALQSGGLMFRVGKNGVMSRSAFGRASADAMATMSKQFETSVMSHVLSGGSISNTTLVQIAKHGYAGHMLSEWQDKEDMLKSLINIDPKKHWWNSDPRQDQINSLEKAKNLLKAAGVQSDSKLDNATGGGRITGNLTIEGRNDLVMKLNAILDAPTTQ